MSPVYFNHEGGKPRKDPIETPMTIIDCMLPISGITEVKYHPWEEKENKRGTI